MLTGEKSLSEMNENDSCETKSNSYKSDRDAYVNECINDYTIPAPAPIMHHEKMREINIREVNKGFILTVGCHTFAFTKTSDFIPELTKYLTNPQETEKDWFSGDLFKQ